MYLLDKEKSSNTFRVFKELHETTRPLSPSSATIFLSCWTKATSDSIFVSFTWAKAFSTDAVEIPDEVILNTPDGTVNVERMIMWRTCACKCDKDTDRVKRWSGRLNQPSYPLTTSVLQAEWREIGYLLIKLLLNNVEWKASYSHTRFNLSRSNGSLLVVRCKLQRFDQGRIKLEMGCKLQPKNLMNRLWMNEDEMVEFMLMMIFFIILIILDLKN